MITILRRFSERFSRSGSSRGQALLLAAVTFVILLAFVGLTTDVGLLFIYYGHLRRAVDAASLAAAAQFREARSIAELTASASQVMNLNGVDPTQYTITVQTCETNPGDTQLCTTPRRKLVRVIAELQSPTAFLHLVGVNTINISASSIGEAASLDVVLVIDISESMVWDAAPGTPYRDPSVCNSADPSGTDGIRGECQPFEEVKRAAINFTSSILNKPPDQEEDRLQIVTFANGWSPYLNQGTHFRFLNTSVSPVVPRWSSDREEVIAEVQNLNVYEPGTCFDPRNDWQRAWQELYGTPVAYYGPCRIYYPDNSYGGFDCTACVDDGIFGSFDWDGALYEDAEWSTFPTTNIGGGLLKAGNMFYYDTREESLWVVVLLTDGMANATDPTPGDRINRQNTYPIGFCPDGRGPTPVLPLCQDENIDTRHANGDDEYDADDYARDMADFVGCLGTNPADTCDDPGQGAVMFAIGLGNEILNNVNEVNDRPYGAALLRYVAARGYDGDTATDPCDLNPDYRDWCGNYYFAPQGPQLSRIFEDIASRIFTRITH